MAKKPPTKRKPRAGAAGDAPPTRTLEQITDGQEQTLFMQHLKKYEDALAAKKAADKRIKDVGKIAKAELGPGAVKRFKLSIQLRDEEGEKEFLEEMAGALKVARWAGVEIGTQFRLFETGEQDSIARARGEGRRASLDEGPAKPPYAPDTAEYTAFMDGYAEANADRAGGIKKPDGEPPKGGREGWKGALGETLAQGERMIEEGQSPPPAAH